MILSSIDPTSRLVVQTVLRHGPIARVGVAQRTGLSSGSMTRLTTPHTRKTAWASRPATGGG